MSIEVVCETVFAIISPNETWLFEGKICDRFFLSEKDLKKYFNAELVKRL